MKAILRNAVWALGVSQCVYWGILYYGFSVLLVPMQSELQLSQTVVAGAFSLGLLVTALVAPLVGRWIDRDHGARTMRWGAAIGVIGLLTSALVTNTVELYAAWVVIGVAMAAILYEPAFGLVIRATQDDAERMRTLATVTIFGGLASTVFLPLLSLSISSIGWRLTQGLGIILVFLVALSLERWAFPALAAPMALSNSETVADEIPAPRGFRPLATIFVIGTLATMGLTTLFIPLLIERGHAANTAAVVLAMMGVMQLPGRIWVLRGGHGNSLHALVTVPLALLAIGMGMVAFIPNIACTAVGVALFGIGAGLQTLARPWLVQWLYGSQHAGAFNGRIARLQGLARAAGPVSAALLSATGGAARVFALLSLALLAIIPMSWSLLKLQNPLAPDKRRLY